MNLGKTIYEHRTKKKLSQGDLANLMNVSRQSVSKWENNSAVPDLEKIIKLSEIFDVSLDELVKGPHDIKENNTQIEKEVVFQQPVQEGRKIAGAILFCMAFVVFLFLFVLTGSIGGILYAMPFFICGLICFTCRNHVGLWCSWAVVLMIDVFLRMATGITIGMVFHTFIWTADMNYTRLAIAWIFLGVQLLLIMITILIFRKKPLKVHTNTLRSLTVGWIAWIVAFLCHQLFLRTQLFYNLIHFAISIPMVYTLCSMLVDWIKVGLLIFLIITTLRVRNSQMKDSD